MSHVPVGNADSSAGEKEAEPAEYRYFFSTVEAVMVLDHGVLIITETLSLLVILLKLKV